MGYRGKLAEQEAASALRAEGHTLADIAAELGVAKSSLSVWVRDVEFEPRPRRRGRRREPNVLQRRKAAEIAYLREEGRARMGDLSDRELLAAGTALYAGDGSKRDGAVRFANSDPDLVRLFCVWLRHFFDVDERRLRVRLYLHEGLDLDAAVSHWSVVTGIPSRQFRSPTARHQTPPSACQAHLRVRPRDLRLCPYAPNDHGAHRRSEGSHRRQLGRIRGACRSNLDCYHAVVVPG